MSRRPSALAVAALLCVSATAAPGAIIVAGYNGYGSSNYVGQSFVWSGETGDALGGFRFLDFDGINPVAASGELYLLAEPYAGTPSGLDSSLALAIGTYDAGFGGWLFAGDAPMENGDTYYVYGSDPFAGYGFGYGYSDGSLFFSYEPDETYSPGLGGASANFELVVVPEPSVAGLLAAGLVGVAARRRR